MYASADVRPKSAEPRWERITAAEPRVVDLVAKGLSNKTVAAALHLSRFNPGTHLKHVFARIGVDSRTALAAEFMKARWWNDT